MDLLERMAALRREGRPFAVATVVARRAPVSAHLGDRAIVFPDGRMEGFIGGACSREIIRQQALEVLQARSGRLVSIRPDAAESGEPEGRGPRIEQSTAEHVVVPMSCASEGAIDVYVEPFVEARRLVVVGATPVAEAVARLARGMDYDVWRVVDAREQHDAAQTATPIGVTVATLDALETILRDGAAGHAEQAAVVASQGHYDEQALTSILKCDVSYVGLVASRKRGATVRALLEENGVPGVAAVRIPAGLDLGARTPSEVALSILAEIVQAHPSGAPAQVTAPGAATAATSMTSSPASAVDPVCGMRVDVATARHTAEVDGVIYYFCCANCRARFLQDPQQYRIQT
jgi:xanthine dehydrogenase accessory factor